MKFGVCGGPEMAAVAKTAGYDYFEWSVGGLLHPREDESFFETALEQVAATGFPCPAVNVFIPGDLKITGEGVNFAALEAFVSTALRRAERAGVKVIVFGSGGARKIPEGFDRERGWAQLVQFGRMLAPLAGQHNVTVVVEPLNLTETNVINSVSEGAKLVHEVNHPNLRLLVDGYHWAKDHETPDGILANGGLLAHTHVATVDGRRPPREGDDCAVFFQLLRQAGYDGRVSIEGNIADPQKELPEALAIMKRLSAA